MTRIGGAAAVICLLALSGCQKKDPGTVADAAFAPGADSSVTTAQVSRWVAANKALDSLSFAYREAFSSQDPAVRQNAQTEFIKAQELACRAAGLSGGLAEYHYVTASLPNPRNKTVRDSLGMRMYQ
jgi:hypothetical protein